MLAGLALTMMLAGSPATCPSRDLRVMLREAGQGLNGRVVEIRDGRVVVEAESRYDDESIGFGERVTIHGNRLPAKLQGRIGIVVRRVGDRWRATRCDVVPGARMANALSGLRPCPAPGLRLRRVSVDGRAVSLRLLFRGDVTSVRLRWDGKVRRRTFEPGIVDFGEVLRFRSGGRKLIRVRAFGAAGPGCGTDRPSTASARRSVELD